MSAKYESKYLERLAAVYLDHYNVHGYAVAKAWYKSFLTEGLQKEIKPYVEAIIAKQPKNPDNKKKR